MQVPDRCKFLCRFSVECETHSPPAPPGFSPSKPHTPPHLGPTTIGPGLPRRVSGLELAATPARRVASVLQLFGAGLDGLALGLQLGEPGDVQEGLGRFSGPEAGHSPIEILAQEVDV